MACDNDNFLDCCPDMDELESPSITESRELVLSDLSEGHELPSEKKSLNEILKRAIQCQRGCEERKRGNSEWTKGYICNENWADNGMQYTVL